MDCYGEFARIYDRLMADVDYEMWSDYIEEIIKRFSKVKVERILELACGTGNITMEFAQKGYSMTCVDISDSMLCMARDKIGRCAQKADVEFMSADMASFEYSAIEAQCVICACDGFNYITKESDLEHIFSEVFGVLPQGGLFIFDMSSYHKIKNVLSDSTFTHVDEDVAYIWENYYDEEDKKVEMELTFFVKKQGGLYERFDELHVQKAYENGKVLKMLEKAGFKNIKALSEFEFEEDDGCAERVFFVAQK